jgi:hypothetical protein
MHPDSMGFGGEIDFAEETLARVVGTMSGVGTLL